VTSKPVRCGRCARSRSAIFDLEDPHSLAQLAESDPALRGLAGLVVIDEIQCRPDLFPLLRALAGRTPLPVRFLILGSASPDLPKQSSETFAGRVETVPLEGVRLADVGAPGRRSMGCGEVALSFTARTEADSLA
jgi:predicted AAA+ superfamily ATPase